MIDYTCPNCNHHMHVSDELSGQHGTCEKCGHKITYPIVDDLHEPELLDEDMLEGKVKGEPDETPIPPLETDRLRTRFNLNWGGLTMNQQISIIGFVLTLFLILMCAGFAWPHSNGNKGNNAQTTQQQSTQPADGPQSQQK